MWLTEKERLTLAVLGALSLVAMGILWWQQQRPPIVVEPAPEQTAHWDQTLASARQIDVNTASVAELERLPGIGPTLAERIADDRAARGPFRRPEELQRVKGIGPQTYDELKDYVTVH